jgi:hypothetical protein
MKSHALSEAEHRSSWQGWLGALVAIIAFAFGAIGLWHYEAQHSGHPDVVSVFYHTLQLFILHAPHLEHATPWPLHVGRLLAAGLVFAAAGKALVIDANILIAICSNEPDVATARAALTNYLTSPTPEFACLGLCACADKSSPTSVCFCADQRLSDGLRLRRASFSPLVRAGL